jgi:predicted small secreted protein
MMMKAQLRRALVIFLSVLLTMCRGFDIDCVALFDR